MSRRIQCNTLSVKPKSDGSCGNVECETLSCKNIICENLQNTQNKITKINIPYEFQLGHISLGMMGTSNNDCSHQIMYTPCNLKTKYLRFIWHDWLPGYPEETVYFKINEKEWDKVVLKETQTFVEFQEELNENDKIITSLYASVLDENEPSIQSLSVNVFGNHEINM